MRKKGVQSFDPATGRLELSLTKVEGRFRGGNHLYIVTFKMPVRFK